LEGGRKAVEKKRKKLGTSKKDEYKKKKDQRRKSRVRLWVGKGPTENKLLKSSNRKNVSSSGKREGGPYGGGE